MRDVRSRQRGPRFARDGFDDGARDAEDFAAEGFVVAGPADAELGFLGPGGAGRVFAGPFGDAGGGAVGEEGGVGFYVGDYFVEVAGGVGEGAGGGEGLGLVG